ncbi:MAG: methyltransferase domain-containing protein, partial [Chloroflexota bacterium]|nr:methyltransferase domain-containing protein [Chloroflexota bacterium]
MDQFHIGGQEATLRLARLAGIHTGQTVLDVGGGLGGPARTLARAFECAVTVVDLTQEYCRVGAMLTSRTGLSPRVAFVNASALNLPFSNDAFDVVWTQHSSMNIANKDRLYDELRRVLRPGGRLALHEIMTGRRIPARFPVPWASDQT